jgi:hypothetical protein
MGGRIIVRGLGLGALAMALNVLVAFAWVFLYSVAIAPGHDGAFYQAYAQRVAPFSAILAGMPILFAAGWLAARGPRPEPAALLPAAAYIILDLVLVAASGLWPSGWSLALSYLTKLAAAWAGGRMAIRRPAVQ